MRNRFKFTQYLAVFSMLIISKLSFAAGASDLTALLDEIKTMQAGFVQTIYDNYGKPVQESYGTMSLARPGKFRWQVDKPMPQVIIANQNKLWIYDPDLEQVTIRSLKAEAGEAPALMLSHKNAEIEKSYEVKEEDGENGMRWFVMVPKNPDNMFAEVKMGFKQRKLQMMRLKDQIGHTTKVVFSKPKYNSSLPNKLFTFKAPAGTDVIDETKTSQPTR